MKTVEIYSVLNHPRVILDTIRDVDEQLEEKRQRYMMRSPAYSDMPRSPGHSARDLSDFVADAEDLICTRRTLEDTYVAVSVAVGRLIRDMGLTNKAQKVLRDYYIYGKTQGQIAAELGVTRSCICHTIKRAVAAYADDE